MTPTVVDAAKVPSRRLVLVQECGGRSVEGVGEHLCARVAGPLSELFEANRQREELTQTVPTQIVLLEQLLDMLGG